MVFESNGDVMGTLKMRVLKTQVLLTGLENASTQYASTENVGTKLLSQDNVSTKDAGTDNACTVEMYGKCEYGIRKY
jgi:hypothetical protein